MSCEGNDQLTGQVATIVLAVSSGAVITDCSTWTLFTFTNAQMIPQISPLGTGDLDYQQLAIDDNAVYICTDTFNQYGAFRGTSALVIKKSSLFSGPVVATVFPGILPGTSVQIQSGITPPADNFDSSPTYGYIINASNSGYPCARRYTNLYLYRIINPGTDSPSISSMITIPVPSYADTANAPHRGNLFGTKGYLQTGGCFLSAPHIRNHQLYVCHSIQLNPAGIGNANGDRVGIRWYQFDLTGDSTGNAGGSETTGTVPALVQAGTLYDNVSVSNPDFYYNGSIMTNSNGDLVIGCTISGVNTYPNVVYAGRKAIDSLGSLRAPATLTASSNPYNFGPFVNPENGNIGQRWGDLSSMSPDPVDDLDIWSTQEFAAINNGWGIQVSQLQPAT